MKSKTCVAFCLAAMCVVRGSVAYGARVVYATGQLLIPGDTAVPPGQPGHDDSRENYLYSIDISTGAATAVSPVTAGLPAALGATANGELWGWAGEQLQAVVPSTGATSPAGPVTSFSATAFDVTSAGAGFGITSGDDQLFQVDLTGGDASPIGAPGLVNQALADAGVDSPDAFIISLGSVGKSLYGIDLNTNSLLAISPDTGVAQLVGPVGAVGAVGDGIFSGFAGLAGVDEDQNGEFDSLFGVVNFINPDGPVGSLRLGGLARFDLGDGSWDLVGLNQGIIFFGMASAPALVPEPSTVLLLAIAGLLGVVRGPRL